MSRKQKLAMSRRDRWIAIGIVAGILLVGGLLAGTGILIPRVGSGQTAGAIPGVHNPASLDSAPRLRSYPAPNQALGPNDLKPDTILALPEAVRDRLLWSLGWTSRGDRLQVRLLLFDGDDAARGALTAERGDEPLSDLGEVAVARGPDRVVFVRGAGLGVVTGPVGSTREVLVEAARALDASLVKTFAGSR